MSNTIKTTFKKRGRPRDERRQDKIIAVATRLFMTQGLQATTMECIARELGVSKLTLYSNFKNKDSLFAAVIENKCKEYIPDSFFDDYKKYPLEESLYKIALGLMQLITSNDARNMERMLMTEAQNHKSLVLTFYKSGPKRVKALMVEYFEKLHLQKKLYIPEPVISSHLFSALIKGSDIYFRISMNISPKPPKNEIEDYCRKAVKMFISSHA